MSRKQEYDWLDDPFNDKKSQQGKMAGGSKVVVGVGCVVALIIIVVLLFMVVTGAANLASSL